MIVRVEFLYHPCRLLAVLNFFASKPCSNGGQDVVQKIRIRSMVYFYLKLLSFFACKDFFENTETKDRHFKDRKSYSNDHIPHTFLHICIFLSFQRLSLHVTFNSYLTNGILALRLLVSVRGFSFEWADTFLNPRYSDQL